MHSLTKNRARIGLLIALLLALAAILVGCSGDDSKPQRSEAKIRDNSYAGLSTRQPAHSMGYSPTRDTINFWIDTWGKDSNKPSYVYLQSATGDLLGYYVLKGLPVSYCAALTPTYRFEGTPNDGSGSLDQQVPAPSVDGVYYSGGQCNTYYGRDYNSNAYIEYTAGLGINVLLYDQPLTNRENVEPLGKTKVGELKR